MSDIIQVTYGELIASFESEVMKAVQQVGINVNKEELLKAMELADKLVRCKDCKHATYKTIPTRGQDAFYGCPYSAIQHDGDFYCAYGERIDNE